MRTLGERLDAAIRASGKTREEVAAEAQTTVQTISRITTGAHDNPELQLLIRLARASRTTVGALLGEPQAITPEDEKQLIRLRNWADERLATIDSRGEPNAVVISRRDEVRGRRIAERKQRPIENPFDEDVHLVLRALGESMREEGILPDDTLYVVPAKHASAAGKVIACRIDGDTFVKRLVAEHRRHYLRSAHPRYRPFEIDLDSDAFELLGVVTGRVGRMD